MKIGILGGGFGVYGYLPAALENGMEVLTLNKYLPVILARPELIKYRDSIRFCRDDQEVISQSQAIIFARDPLSQQEFLRKFAGQFEYLFLEKPLTYEPARHKEFIHLLESRSQPFSVGYLLPFTNWFRLLALKQTGSSSIRLVWRIKSNFNSWKTQSFEDFGLFTYFGIHTVPLLTLKNVSAQNLTVEFGKDFKTIFVSDLANSIKIDLISDTSSDFKITQAEHDDRKIVYESQSPFGEMNYYGKPDMRIPLIQEYLSTSLSSTYNQEILKYERLAAKIRNQLFS